jgi:hypothetical protein
MERTFVVKKLIALLVIAGFLLVAGTGCPGSTTKSTGGTSTGTSTKP